jgi:carbon starvation protein CstA
MSPLLLLSILMLPMFGFFTAGMDFLLLLLLLVSLLMLASLLLLASLPYGVFAVAISIEIPLILGSHVKKMKNMSVQIKNI